VEKEMDVLITGGTGFIGSRLALKYLESGDSVRVIGQENNQAEMENRKLIEAEGAEIILGSMTDRKLVSEVVEGMDLVFHLAAAQHEANVADEVFWKVNVTGTRNILDASVDAKVERFVHGSTIGVYGAALEGNVNEQSALKPNNIYGITKLEGEKVVMSFDGKLPFVIVRISETYGPGDRRLLKLFKGIKKNIFFIIGDGENLHHLLYIDDLIEGLLLSATCERAIAKTFVLSGKDAVSTNSMVAEIARQLGKTIPRFRAPLSPFLVAAAISEGILRPLGIQPPLHKRRMDFFRKSFVFSQEESAKTLGFLAKVSFTQGVSDTIQWYTQMGYL
jgi:nucleoside-diphosphate-sugar epimerase